MDEEKKEEKQVGDGNLLKMDEIRCIRCAGGGKMIQVAHVNDNGDPVGIIFVCIECIKAVQEFGMRIKIEDYTEKRIIKKPGIISLN